jgi:hypothetical protein
MAIRRLHESALESKKMKSQAPMLPDDPNSRDKDSTVQISADVFKIVRDARQLHSTLPPLGWQAFTHNHRLGIEVAGFPRLVVTVDRDLVLGRGSSLSDYRPDINLEPYGGQRMGVSRRHAVLRCVDDELYLADLGSRSGTMINEHRISAHTLYVLQSEGVIALGALRLRVHFINTSEL